MTSKRKPLKKKRAAKLLRFDPACDYDSPEMVHAGVNVACEDPDGFDAKHLIEVIAKGIGLVVMARTAGVSHRDLTYALTAEWNEPLFEDVLAKVVETYRKQPHPI